MTTRSVPLEVSTCPEHGGRWTSLRAGDREWLWSRAAVGRDRVGPGDPFVDAGGLEECLPTVQGAPDHGDVWARPWSADPGGGHVVITDRFSLHRRIDCGEHGVVASYELQAEAGYAFVWAAHALLAVSPGARLELPMGLPVRPQPSGDGRHAWPLVDGVDLSLLGPDDGTAVAVVVVGARTAEVLDGTDRLRFSVDCEDAPVSVALWRNLRGWPAEAPYRSIGVEPMLGRTMTAAGAAPEDTAVVPASGTLRWTLRVTATRERS